MVDNLKAPGKLHRESQQMFNSHVTFDDCHPKHRKTHHTHFKSVWDAVNYPYQAGESYTLLRYLENTAVRILRQKIVRMINPTLTRTFRQSLSVDLKTCIMACALKVEPDHA